MSRTVRHRDSAEAIARVPRTSGSNRSGDAVHSFKTGDRTRGMFGQFEHMSPLVGVAFRSTLKINEEKETCRTECGIGLYGLATN